jgi:hypothetical protein
MRHSKNWQSKPTTGYESHYRDMKAPRVVDFGKEDI